MSEQAWRDFLAADLDDWVVLHGGATAAFRTASIEASGRLAAAIAKVPAMADSMVLTLTGSRLTVRLTRGLFAIEPEHVELARAISSIAREHGATAEPGAVQEISLAIAAKPDEIDVGFWRAVLGYAPLADDNAIDPLGHGSTVWMQDLDVAKPLRHAMHVDVAVAIEHAEARLAAALAAGGRIVDDSNAPGSWILADRAGNKVCIVAWPDGAATPAWAAPDTSGD